MVGSKQRMPSHGAGKTGIEIALFWTSASAEESIVCFWFSPSAPL